MNEKERALRQAMEQKQEEIRGLLETDKLSEAEEKTEELRKMKRKLDVMRELDLPQVVPPAARSRLRRARKRLRCAALTSLQSSCAAVRSRRRKAS